MWPYQPGRHWCRVVQGKALSGLNSTFSYVAKLHAIFPQSRQTHKLARGAFALAVLFLVNVAN